MSGMPEGVQITSIKNTSDRHIEIIAKSRDYNQLGFFKAKLKTDTILNNVVSTASHEMGHLLERTLIEQRNTDSNDLIGKLEWRNCTQAKLVVSEACKAAKKTTDGRGLRNSQLKKGVSGYAVTDDSECLAEAVADYIINRDKASVLSRMIWNILKRELG